MKNRLFWTAWAVVMGWSAYVLHFLWRQDKRRKEWQEYLVWRDELVPPVK